MPHAIIDTMPSNLSPALLEQVHPTKNPPTLVVDIKGLSVHSQKSIWWLGTCGHEWETPFRNRAVKGYGCPYCSNKKVLAGYNDLATTHPNTSSQWHLAKNQKLLPIEVSHGSKNIVWWQCEQGHEWQAAVRNRVIKNQGCPYCSNKKIQVGYNDFATTHPKLTGEWHPTKNALTPQEVTAGMSTEVWWTCEKGHDWQTRVSNRVYGSKCHICTSRKVQDGYNDLSTLNPTVATQWHPTKNLPVKPADYTVGSNIKVWWQCENKHEWEAKIADRKLHGCPVCNTRTSLKQDALEKFFATFDGLNVIVGDRSILQGKELDFYFPELKVAVEFNGLYWHTEEMGRGKKAHEEKYLECQTQGIQLLQIWEDDWDRSPELVKTMLKHKLGKSNHPRVFARQTEVVALGEEETREFLLAHHIQGHTTGSLRIALRERGTEEIVAVMVLRKEPSTEPDRTVLNLLRYATSSQVIGGFTKLLTYVERTQSPSKIITFSDNCVSAGGLYSQHGFTVGLNLKPDYMYVVKGVRVHKFNYRKARFKNDEHLLYQDGLTEQDLASLNGLRRVWDAGKVRWEKDFFLDLTTSVE